MCTGRGRGPARSFLRWAWPAVWIAVAAGCAHVPPPAQRLNAARTIAHRKGWSCRWRKTGAFHLFSCRPAHPSPSSTLTVYIEGDGFAWFSREQPSLDPTPINPVGLKLALAQPRGNAAYLARPCQYQVAHTTHCPVRFWTRSRFGPAVIRAENRAVSRLKHRFNARYIELVGYSGGAAVALLVAARRDDVQRLITVAGNVEPRAWARLHDLTPLSGSLDPVNAIPRIRTIPQWDIAGAADRNVPPRLTRQFAARFPAANRPTVVVERGLGHHSGWAQRWPSIWRGIQRRPASEPRNP